MENDIFSSEFVKAHINTIILSTLLTGEKYGYEIHKDIIEKTKGKFELKQPTLYAGLKRLETAGYIKSFWKNSDIGGKRHYYTISEEGINEIAKNKDNWGNSQEIVNLFLGASPLSNIANEQEKNIVNEINEVKQNLINNSFLDEKDFKPSSINLSKNLNAFKNAMNELNGKNSLNLNSAPEQNITDLENVSNLKNSIENQVAETAEGILNENLSHDDLSLFNILEEVKENPNISMDTTRNNNVLTDSTFIENNIKNDIVSNEINVNNNINDAIFLTSLSPSISSNIHMFKAYDNNIGAEPNVNFNEKAYNNKNEQIKNDAVFIRSNINLDGNSQLINPEYEKQTLSKNFTSDNFSLEINYVSTPLKIDKIAEKARNEQITFERNALDKKYTISNRTKWANIKIPTKYYNVNKLNFLVLLLLIPIILVEFLSLYLLANYFNILSKILYSSFILTSVIFGLFMLYFVLAIIINPNHKSKKKNNFNILYSTLISIILILITISIYNLQIDTALFMNTNTFLWLTPSIMFTNLIVFSLIKFCITKSSTTKYKKVIGL